MDDDSEYKLERAFSKHNKSDLNVTPDISDENQFPSQVRFNRDTLIASLKSFIKLVSNIPIEKFEIDLYRISRIFHEQLHGKKITIRCIERIHHIQKLTSGRYTLDEKFEDKMKTKVENMIQYHPMATSQYELSCQLLELFNHLCVKWEIGSFSNYAYRYAGRALNVKMLDLDEMNKNFMNMDTLWISSRLDVKPLTNLYSHRLTELSIVLHNQLNKCFDTFLMLNPREINEVYEIEENIAFKSRGFLQYSSEVVPKENLGNFKHTELKLIKGAARCFSATDPRVDFAFRALQELEMAYREFEKSLIAAILKATGKADF